MPPSAAALEDYWEILGLQPGASKTDVGKAYRKKSMQVHPDRYKGNDPQGAAEEFLRLTRAKEVLEDDKARAAFEAVQRARAMHREKQAAQDGARRRMREDLEVREEEARKRARNEASSVAAQAQAQLDAQAEAAARKELQRELERLRRTGRLDGARAATAAAHDLPPLSAAGVAPQSDMARVTLRWNEGRAMEAADLTRLLVEHGAPPGVAVAVAGCKAVAELPISAARAVAERSIEFAARGVRLAVQLPPEEAAGKVAPLPAGWREHSASDGRPYFYHTGTGHTSWDRPREGASRGWEDGGDGAGNLDGASISVAELEQMEARTMQRLREAAERQRRCASAPVGTC